MGSPVDERNRDRPLQKGRKVAAVAPPTPKLQEALLLLYGSQSWEDQQPLGTPVLLPSPFSPFSLGLLSPTLGLHICQGMGKPAPSSPTPPWPRSLEPLAGWVAFLFPAVAPGSQLPLWPQAPSSQPLAAKQKVGLHQVVASYKAQGLLWVRSRAVVASLTSASRPVAVSAWLLGPEFRCHQAALSLPSG